MEEQQQKFRFQDLLEKKLVPMRHKQPPLWDPSTMPGGIPAALRSVFRSAHIPTLNWSVTDPETFVPEGTELVEIDANGAFVAAATSTNFAHCALEHTGRLELETGTVPPGYMLVDAHPWQLGAPGSPLGAGRPKGAQIWVPHTVYATLRDLTHGAKWGAIEGHWPDCTVYDSWTADPVRFTDWSGFVRDTRATHKRERTVHYDAVKVGYSQAVQMWSTEPDPKGTPREEQKKKNRAYRPDWYAALRGQHAMNMWRRAYTATVLDCPPLRVWDTDRMLFTADHLTALLTREQTPMPVQLDETGISLGTFKRVKRWYAGIED